MIFSQWFRKTQFLWEGPCYQYGKRYFLTSGMKTQQIPLTQEEMRKLRNLKVKQPANPRTLQVSIIGAPNVGKSTLANRILGRRFTSVSGKVHTTRANILGVLTENQTQVIFKDTPGLITPKTRKKHNLEASLLVDPHLSLSDTDLLLVVVDAGTIWGRERLDPEVLKVLHVHRDKTAVLVLNKIDLVTPKSKLLSATRILTDGVVNNQKHWKHIVKPTIRTSPENIIDNLDNSKQTRDNDNSQTDKSESSEADKQTTCISLDNKEEWWKIYEKKLREAEKHTFDRTGWPLFYQVFMVSALEGNGVEDLMEFLLDMARPGKWQYPQEMVTDQDPKHLALMCVQEKLLDQLPKEIPYLIDIEMVMFEEDENGYLRTAFDVVCSRNRDVKYALGPKGETIRKISMEAKKELMNTFHRDLSLRLAVCKKGE